MSEPQTPAQNTGAAFGGTVKGEKAQVPPEFQEPTEPEVTEAAEAAEEAQAIEQDVAAEPVEGEATELTPDELVRQTTERLRKQAQEQAAPTTTPENAFLQGQLTEIKDQIRRMGEAQDEPEPEGGFDYSVLESPEIQAQLVAAKESDDPQAWPRALAVIAQHVVEAERGKDTGVQEVRQELEDLKQRAKQQQLMEYNRQVFDAGLEAASNLGGVPQALVKEFRDNGEQQAIQAHYSQQGSLNGYQPRSLLGAWLMNTDPQTGQPNALFAANPTLMQAGVMKLAHDVAGANLPADTSQLSTTGAGVHAGASDASKQITNKDGELSPEDQILAGLLEANKVRKGKAKAFR